MQRTDPTRWRYPVSALLVALMTALGSGCQRDEVVSAPPTDPMEYTPIAAPETTVHWQGALVLGAAEWMRTLIVLVRMRVDLGLSSTRLIIILTAVAILTIASTLVFTTSRARSRFKKATQK